MPILFLPALRANMPPSRRYCVYGDNMPTNPHRDLESIVDINRLSRFQIAIIALCGLIALLDGFDTQAIAFVAPSIAAAWNLAPSAFGPVFGAGLLGGLIGAITLGMASDRLGRKPTLVAAVLLFAAGSLTTLLAHSLWQLGVLRFVTGLGLGGALPSFIALSSEYAPKRLRTALVGMMFCGFPVGAVIGGFASAHLIPVFGWASVFLAGGVLPLLILPIFIAVVPESMRFLALRRNKAAIESVLARMQCADAWNGDMSTHNAEEKAPVSQLFVEGRFLGTVLLWATLFLSLLLTYFLVNWIPLVVSRSGLPIRSAVLAVTMLNLGAVIGCLLIGRLSSRYSATTLVGSSYVLGAVAIALLSQAGSSVWLLYAITFAAGAFSIGAQMSTVAMCANFYESFLRSTGVGWAMGVGRVGAIAGPVLGGMLLASGTAVPLLFIVVGLTSLGSGVAVFVLGRFVMAPRRESVSLALGAEQALH